MKLLSMTFQAEQPHSFTASSATMGGGFLVRRNITSAISSPMVSGDVQPFLTRVLGEAS